MDAVPPPAPMPRVRLAVLAGGGFALLMGVWTGLARAGVHRPVGPIGAHGVIMVLGFLGTVIALERAVAHGRRWSLLAPVCSAGGVIVLVAGLPTWLAGLLLTTAGLLVLTMFADFLRVQGEVHLALMATGAVAWVVAALGWTLGWSPVRIAPTLAAFLVLTIVGERVELSRLRSPSPAVVRRLLVATGVFAAGVVTTLVAWRTGLVLAGVGLLAQATWLLRHDLARVTVRRPGLPRFAATCLLAGYAWLAAAGALWIAEGFGVGPSLLHDAALHALFLGFVISMVMGHAPIILPAVLRTPLPHTRWDWTPLALLHASVALRVGADLAGSTWLRGWAAHGNVTALLVFVAGAAVTATRARTRSPSPDLLHVPRPTRTAP